MPDKLYMQYIILFYQWMRLDANLESQMRIIEFAERFMRPADTLRNNASYAYNLARYSSNSTATRTILYNMKFFQDLRNVSFCKSAACLRRNLIMFAHFRPRSETIVWRPLVTLW